jgi:hypothetical protein
LQVLFLVDKREQYQSTGQARMASLDTHLAAVWLLPACGPGLVAGWIIYLAGSSWTCLPRLPGLVQMRSSALTVEERHLPIGDAMWIARSR